MNDLNWIDDMQGRINGMVPEFRGWYQGFSDAGFWANGFNNETITLPAPDLVIVQNGLDYLSQDFDPGALWDIIIWGDDGRICLFRIKPQEPQDLHQVLIEFSTTEGDIVPTWATLERSDFIEEYNRQRVIIKTRYAYLPGSNK